FVVWPWKLVTRRAVPPPRSTTQMLFAYAKAICVALTVGDRSRRVSPPLGDAASAAAKSGRNSQARRFRIAFSPSFRLKAEATDLERDLPPEGGRHGLTKKQRRKPGRFYSPKRPP